jgi:hypothetical protein
MKKLIPVIILFVLSTTLKAQTVNGIPLKSIPSYYIQVTLITPIFSRVSRMKIEYGRETETPELKAGLLKEAAEGEVIQFPSQIDALNFMLINGFELIGTNAEVNNGNSWSNVFIFRNMNKKLE